MIEIILTIFVFFVFNSLKTNNKNKNDYYDDYCSDDDDCSNDD